MARPRQRLRRPGNRRGIAPFGPGRAGPAARRRLSRALRESGSRPHRYVECRSEDRCDQRGVSCRQLSWQEAAPVTHGSVTGAVPRLSVCQAFCSTRRSAVSGTRSAVLSLQPRVRCRAASWRILAEGVISGLGGCRIASWPGVFIVRKALPWSSLGTISRGRSSISARNSCCMARSRIKAAVSVSLPSAARCKESHSVSLAGAGSAERRGSIFRPGWRRRSLASAAMPRLPDEPSPASPDWAGQRRHRTDSTPVFGSWFGSPWRPSRSQVASDLWS